jgi:phosphatidate cytidylyltransferase
MTRVLSALVLLPSVIAVVWFLPPVATLLLAVIAAALAFSEYAAIAAALGAHVPRLVSGTAVVAGCAALGSGWGLAEVVLMTAVITLGALAVGSGQPGPAILRDVSAAWFPVGYVGLPLGALAAVRESGGRGAVLLLMITIVVSDSAQYYTGRAFGRTPLAPAISPKKTIEGALGGVVLAPIFMVLVGSRVLPGAPWLWLALTGLAIVVFGICGDLFESRLKRAAGVKDSSTLIPGHGGVLDRIDALLFATPAYYLFLRTVA